MISLAIQVHYRKTGGIVNDAAGLNYRQSSGRRRAFFVVRHMKGLSQNSRRSQVMVHAHSAKYLSLCSNCILRQPLSFHAYLSECPVDVHPGWRTNYYKILNKKLNLRDKSVLLKSYYNNKASEEMVHNFFR